MDRLDRDSGPTIKQVPFNICLSRLKRAVHREQSSYDANLWACDHSRKFAEDGKE